APPALRRHDGPAVAGPRPDPARPRPALERGARLLRHRRDRLQRALRGDQGQRSLQCGTHEPPAHGPRGGRLGPRGCCRVRREAPCGSAERSMTDRDEWPLWEVFVRAKRGLSHVHVGSLHAPDAQMAVRNARDLYTRRQEGAATWVVPADEITASSPDEKDAFFEPAGDKIY